MTINIVIIATRCQAITGPYLPQAFRRNLIWSVEWRTAHLPSFRCNMKQAWFKVPSKKNKAGGFTHIATSIIKSFTSLEKEKIEQFYWLITMKASLYNRPVILATWAVPFAVGQVPLVWQKIGTLRVMNHKLAWDNLSLTIQTSFHKSYFFVLYFAFVKRWEGSNNYAKKIGNNRWHCCFFSYLSMWI